MSPRLRIRKDGRLRPARYGSLQWPMLVWLTLIWLVLWRDISPITVVGGFLVAVVSCLVFPLPPLRLEVTVRPLALVRLVVRFAYDVVVSSVQVISVVLRPKRVPLRNALVKVQLRTPSDFVLTIVAEMTTLIPGSVVVEAHRSTHTLYIHVLDVRDQEGIERFKQSVLDQEERVVRALGRNVDQFDEPAPVTTGGER